jgi:hypothetical protein
VPDLVADMHNIGLGEKYMEALFKSAEEYIRVWERARLIGTGVEPGTGEPPEIQHSCPPLLFCDPDTVEPQITCPADITVGPDSPEGKVVAYAAEFWFDACDDNLPTPSCPLSGTAFGVGTETEVTCDVTDATGLSSSCSLTVTVLSESEVLADLLERVVELIRDGSLDPRFGPKLSRRISRMATAFVKGKLRKICRQLDRWDRLIERKLSGELANKELQSLLDPVADLRATAACPE